MIEGDQERRKDLCFRKELFSKRVAEIRIILEVKRGIQHNQILGQTRNRKEYKEWVLLAGKLAKLEREIKKIPAIKKGVPLSGKISEILRQNHPHIFDECIELARKLP